MCLDGCVCFTFPCFTLGGNQKFGSPDFNRCCPLLRQPALLARWRRPLSWGRTSSVSKEKTRGACPWFPSFWTGGCRVPSKISYQKGSGPCQCKLSMILWMDKLYFGSVGRWFIPALEFHPSQLVPVADSVLPNLCRPSFWVVFPSVHRNLSPKPRNCALRRSAFFARLALKLKVLLGWASWKLGSLGDVGQVYLLDVLVRCFSLTFPLWEKAGDLHFLSWLLLGSLLHSCFLWFSG